MVKQHMKEPLNMVKKMEKVFKMVSITYFKMETEYVNAIKITSIMNNISECIKAKTMI